MNSNLNKAFKKNSAGNYFGYYLGYYIFAFKRPHGRWSCRIGRKGEWLWSEGYFGTSLPNLSRVKDWIRSKIMPSYKILFKHESYF